MGCNGTSVDDISAATDLGDHGARVPLMAVHPLADIPYYGSACPPRIPTGSSTSACG
ncbi:hypothetical protein [Streptomyces griseorubiginosus]|uniref:hypothetical protein n=1 Tax=Streptomyces griseorubiginosus TaxID=67304 RepID=UPI002E802E87|nr:hypothetical protein [Streptomyces griseorubiginosus]WUB42825.1 hypothetical protein OHN19_05565 [Streptomyces griseorubiginosus]WUB51344.1 hypothetical protein OG942_05560 [Streptomyces griseorubiginosus]